MTTPYESTHMVEPNLQRSTDALVYFDSLLRDPDWADELADAWNADDDTVLAAHILANLDEEIPESEQSQVVSDLFTFIFEVSGKMLDYTATQLGVELDVSLFKRISTTFRTFDEPWEQHIEQGSFVEFANGFEKGESTLPLHRSLMVAYVLARGCVEFPEVQKDNVTLTAVAIAHLMDVVAEQRTQAD